MTLFECFRIKPCEKMRAGRSTVLTAPLLYNSSCWHPRIFANGLVFRITVSGVTESAFVSLLTVAILVANLMVIVTINSDKYTKFIHPQVKFHNPWNEVNMSTMITKLYFCRTIKYANSFDGNISFLFGEI